MSLCLCAFLCLSLNADLFAGGLIVMVCQVHQSIECHHVMLFNVKNGM